MQEVVLFCNGLDVLTRQILYSRGAIPSKTTADAKVAIQEMAEYSQKWHNGTSRIKSTETSDGLAAIQAQLNNLIREIKKVNEKVYVAQVGCEQCKGHHYTKYCLLKEERKTLKESYYTQFGAPLQGGGYRATAPGFYQRNNVNPSYQERKQSMEDTLRKLIRASIKTLEIQIGQISKVLQKRGFGSLPSSIETNPRDHVKSISTIIEADSSSIRRMESSQYAVSTGQNRTLMSYSEASYINNSIPRKEKDLGSFTLPCFINNVCFDNALADLGASVSVMPLSTYLNLGLGELAHTRLTVELADRTVKYPKGIVENVLVGMGDVIFGKPFLREVGINAKRFEGMITIQNGNEEVTYQMVRSHPRFKHHTNEQCNKIPPLLKVSEEDKMNGISHSYQKLKGFYKGVLNLGPEFIRVPSMEEWLTRGHISVHEME
ncbi:homeodomain-like protein [Tanacetum coccineum]